MRSPSGEPFVGEPFVEVAGENNDKRLDELGVVADEDGEESRSKREDDECVVLSDELQSAGEPCELSFEDVVRNVVLDRRRGIFIFLTVSVKRAWRAASSPVGEDGSERIDAETKVDGQSE